MENLLNMHQLPILLVHPVAQQPFTRQMAPHGVVGTLFARGTANSASLIALLEGRVFAQLPKLRIVVTALAFDGVAMAASLSGNTALDIMRQHAFIDTMWPQPTLIKAAVDLLGADNVLAGSDWPIVDQPPFRSALGNAMEQARLTEDQMRAVASGNVRRLLSV
jgi:predicted TIM-barrel fold metal-dependent hydrolase